MAKAKAKGKGDADIIEIAAIETMEVNVCLLGSTPFLFNRLSEKARHELFMPAGPKNRAEKAMRLKHDPYTEFRSSVYCERNDEAPTRLFFPGGAFRRALATAALDVPGSSKAQVGRLVRVTEYNVAIYGVPQLSCMIVRQAGQNRTPDVRTRAILPQWCCRITLRFAFPLLKEKAILNLLAAAGEFIGVGDGRSEKGSSLTCGCFAIVAEDNEDFLRICSEQGRGPQDAALAEPVAHDLETEELLGWFDSEIIRRDLTSAINNGQKTEEKVKA